MKLMKRLMRKNNKGMSLVELICAVAILGLTTTALGGAMVMSAQHYYRDSAEFEVQQEAQTATNLIGNLVVDAAEAEWAGNKLTIKADGKTHVIYQDDDKLVYENTTDGTDGILAEGLPDGAFSANTDDFDTNKTVNISLKVENGGKEFTSNYNATSRNGELSTAEFAEKVCVISMEDEVVLEPNQSFDMPLDVLGMDFSEVGGITVDRTGVPSGWDTDDAIKFVNDGTNKKIELVAPPNAAGNFTFVVKTGNKPGTTTPWATKTIQVKIRRVDAVMINLVSGAGGYTAGSEYEFSASVTVGSNLSKGYGKGYDYDYKNPKWIDFEISGVNYTIIEDKSKTDTPYIKFKLTSDMAVGDTIIVKAVSAHAKGTIAGTKYNKTGTFYGDVNSPWSDICPNITPTPTIDPNYPLPNLPSGMLRGEDYGWGLSVPSCDTLKGTLAAKYNTPAVAGFEMHYEWFVSFKERDNASAVWTPWHMTCQAGNNQKIDGTYETTIMLPDKAYDLRFFILYYDKSTKEVFYPHDESLLAPGNGLYEAGFKKGWADEDAAATDFIQYGKSTMLPAVSMYYYNNPSNANDNIDGLVEGQVYDSVGTKDNPLKYKFGQSQHTFQISYNMRHLSLANGSMYTYKPVVWKYNESTKKWDEITDLSKIMNCEISSGNTRYVEIKDIQNYANTDTLKTAACGTYRIGIVLGGKAKDYTSVAADCVRLSENAGFKDVDITPMSLYDESGTNGFIYFKIEK